MNNWEKAAALYRKRQWRAYRDRDNKFDPSLPRILGQHSVSVEIDPCPDCIKAAQLCDLYGAFERTINRCADGRPVNVLTDDKNQNLIREAQKIAQDDWKDAGTNWPKDRVWNALFQHERQLYLEMAAIKEIERERTDRHGVAGCRGNRRLLRKAWQGECVKARQRCPQSNPRNA